LPAVGIAVGLAPGFEADDVMGTLAVQTKDFGSTAIIVSTDRDLLQLVQENIEVYVPGKVPLRIQDGASVFDRMGVHPTGITTFKALAGDASDNIPGVRGIGSRTASSLVNRYQTLEEIFRSLSQLPARVSGALQSQREEAFLFRELVTVRTDIDLPVRASKLPILRLDPKISIRDLLEKSWHW
jgi:DNA polymerase I